MEVAGEIVLKVAGGVKCFHGEMGSEGRRFTGNVL